MAFFTLKVLLDDNNSKICHGIKMLSFSRQVFGFCLAALIIVADQISKIWILGLFQPVTGKPPSEITITPFFDLVLVWNKGVSFGLFNHDSDFMPWVLIALALALVGFVVRWLWRAETWAEAAAFGLIIGGALGNVIDRVRFGAVVDFLDFHWAGHHWPAFNVADSAIVVGAGLVLCLWGLGGKTKP